MNNNAILRWLKTADRPFCHVLSFCSVDKKRLHSAIKSEKTRFKRYLDDRGIFAISYDIDSLIKWLLMIYPLHQLKPNT